MTDKSILRRTAVIMVPVILQNLIVFSVNMIDAVMMTGYGQSEFAAATLANQAWYIYTMFMFGLSTGVCILTSQYYGRKDSRKITAVIFIGLGFSLIIGIIFAAVLFFAPETFLRIYTNDEHLIKLGAEYLRLIAPGYIITSFTVLYSSYLKSVERATAPLIFSGVSITLSTVLGYIFIFGAFGVPEMGIKGAALSTLIARVAEAVVIAVYFIKKEIHIKLKFDFIQIKALITDFLKYSGPVILNELIWGIGVSFYFAIFGRMGEDVTAAFSLNSNVEKFGMIACLGLTQSAAVILGVELGKGNLDIAKKYSKYFMKMAIVFGLVCGGIVYAATPLILKVFSNLTLEAVIYYKQFVLVLAIFFVLKSYTMMGVCSVLRAGGDSTAALVIDVFIMWVLTNPLAWVLVFSHNWQPQMVYLVLISEEIIKLPILIYRIRQGRWLNNLTKENFSI